MDLPHSCLRSIHDSFTDHSRSRKWVRRWRAVCLRLTFGACGTRALTLATDAVSKGAGEVERVLAEVHRLRRYQRRLTLYCGGVTSLALTGLLMGATAQRSASIDVIETMLPMDSCGRCSRPKMSACTRSCASDYPSCDSWQDAVAQCDASAARRSGPAAPAGAGHTEGEATLSFLDEHGDAVRVISAEHL